MISWNEFELLRSDATSSCPVCGSEAPSVHQLPRELLRTAFQRYYRVKPPEAALEYDYTLHRCSACGLEFGMPLDVPNAFYPWVTAQAAYYPEHREEWALLFRILEGAPSACSTLEVGCGSGAFLDAAATAGWRGVVGVDLAQASVDICRAKGHNAVAGDLKDLSQLLPPSQSRFDLVVGFHVLEHVPDPVGLTADSLRVLAPGGRVFFSLPMSPNDHEHLMFDPILFPPHHLTRWTKTSFEALAKRVGAKLTIHPLRRRPLLRRFSHTLFCFQKARGDRMDSVGRLSLIVRAPVLALSELRWQVMRGITESILSNHVVIELQPLGR